MAMKTSILQLREIVTTGFSTFFIDVAMGILTILFNRQIMKYLGANALALSGILILLLPIVAGADALWLAMPVTELLVIFYVIRNFKEIPIT